MSISKVVAAFVVLSGLFSGFIASPVVYAAPPQCFGVGNNAEYIPRECQSFPGVSLSDDKCYLETGSGQAATDYDEIDCNEAGAPAPSSTQISVAMPSSGDCDDVNDGVERAESTYGGCISVPFCSNESLAVNTRIAEGCSEDRFGLVPDQSNPIDGTGSVTNRFNPDCKESELNAGNCGIVRYIQQFIRFLTIVVGIAVAIMIAYGGIRYTMSRDDPQAVQQAKAHIRNAVIALLKYIFALGFLNYLVPGGVF